MPGEGYNAGDPFGTAAPARPSAARPGFSTPRAGRELAPHAGAPIRDRSQFSKQKKYSLRLAPLGGR
jgi:hypothetical protein